MVLARHASVAMTLFIAAALSPARADCTALMALFADAVSSRSLDAAQKIEKSIYLDDSCSASDADVKDRLVAFEVDLLGDPALAQASREAALAHLRRPGRRPRGATPAHAPAGRCGRRRFDDASDFYDRAIGLAGDPAAMSDGQKRDLLAKAAAAKLLASDDDGGRRRADLAATTRGAGGMLGGIYARSMRGVVPTAVPLPINFVTDSTEFSPVGAKAAEELADYLKQQQVASVTLIGHTDERGPDAYNVALSEARVRRVAAFLVQRGVTSHVTAVGKGWHAPLDVGRLPYTPTQEEVWALNRRVDLLR